ncbi:MAG: hypothetical protein RLY86_1486 [Pseudomonadota bacterium]|jgi:iron complex outermembrane receptor protein
MNRSLTLLSLSTLLLATCAGVGAAAAQTQPAQTQPAKTPAAQSGAIEEIIVLGWRTDYRVVRSSAGTKTDTPLLQTPVAVNAVSAQVMEDLKLPRLRDALENVSSVRPNGSIGSGNSFIIRGFADARRVFIDGLNVTANAERGEFDSAVIERVEVLKGPASVLYGRSEPGGIVNIVTRRPLGEAAYVAEVQAGPHDTIRGLVDATGPLTQDGAIAYRLIGVYQDGETFRDLSRNDRRLIAPSLRWRLSEATEWTVGVEHSEQDYIADFGIPVLGTRPIDVPVERSYGDPNDTVDTFDRTQVTSQISHDFSEDWGLRSRVAAVFNETQDDFINPAPAFSALPDGATRMERNIFFQITDSEAYSTNLDLVGKLRHGNVEHALLFGIDYLYQESFYSTFGNFRTPNPALTIDLFNPAASYGIPRAVFDLARTVPTTAGRNVSYFRNEFVGVYGQNQITIGEKIHLLAGLRWDQADTGRSPAGSREEAEQLFDVNNVRRRDREVSPRLGALYEITGSASVYASWAQSFGANQGITATGQTQPPQGGEQYEIGAKAETADGRFSVTLALYNLTLSNRLTPDLSTPDPADSIAIGESRSRGLELDATGRILPGLDLIASYAYTDGEVTRDASGIQGKALVNVPEHAASLAFRYEFQPDHALAGLFIGGGVYAVGDRFGDTRNTFTLPGYVRLDGLAGYRWSIGETTMTAQVNVKNLTDERYFESADPNSNVGPRLGVYPGAPREFLASLRAEF